MCSPGISNTLFNNPVTKLDPISRGINGVLNPGTKDVSVTSNSLYGKNLTAANVNDADNRNPSGVNRNLGTQNSSMSDRIQNLSILNSGPSGSFKAMMGQNDQNKRYILAQGNTAYGTTRST